MCAGMLRFVLVSWLRVGSLSSMMIVDKMKKEHARSEGWSHDSAPVRPSEARVDLLRLSLLLSTECSEGSR